MRLLILDPRGRASFLVFVCQTDAESGRGVFRYLDVVIQPLSDIIIEKVPLVSEVGSPPKLALLPFDPYLGPATIRPLSPGQLNPIHGPECDLWHDDEAF